MMDDDMRKGTTGFGKKHGEEKHPQQLMATDEIFSQRFLENPGVLE